MGFFFCPGNTLFGSQAEAARSKKTKATNQI
jgi:hypothetical protein